jgi:hypothetical protein
MAIMSVKASSRVAGLVICASLVAALAPGAVRAAGLEGASVIAIVNKQRAANGIPPITTLDQTYASSWCPREFEVPTSNGETGRVSASEDEWTAEATPYSTAPLHQYVIYAPLATVAGDVHTAAGVDCMGVGEPQLLSSISTSPPALYAFVNERGPRYAVASELARELPTTPQQQLGEPASTRTGPQILLFAVGLGFSPKATSISLRTSAGATVPDVKVATQVDGGVLVPPPLKAGTAYTLQVGWSGEAQQTISGFEVTTTPQVTATQTLSFATAPAPRTTHRRRRHERTR